MGMKKLILAGALGFAALSGTNLPGLEATKASAASIETNFSTLEGRVVEVDHGVIVVKSKQYEEPVSVYIENISNVKVGDEVKATGSMMRNFTEYMIATEVKNTTNKLGMHLKENGSPDYLIGEVSEVGKMEDSTTKYVVVEYPTQNGEKDVIDVFLTKGQVFKTGEKVKIDMKYVGWGGIFINYNTVDHIEKVHDVNNSTQNNDDVWIWS
ncbi:ATP F0F1 synthase subunit alpha [Bacillus toyonensis]|uniref:ATP F0F1 synthase subunit alpha n=1 Tax=Bacillus toyonensis TaxID=155322 RepID=UPI000BF06BDE|nr:ATP F0F1 synthase subunit alpha [Bacillus toyonensis]PEM16464.1 ATP F0F1 synthase subunit alpha [Bacillus toyonensis]PGA45579.1 ATP F0F1 synthase subunit alpha [Bacillus toyonensis]PGB25823.1 ATP F0F1 synthase subunit alpha [Bacillus toyonensis]PGC36214.1 ATP F0F1 synthase subunit alpha [Bacillus toyonensis]PHF86164.1 ATP F0F1 synthase subunit alpha [Bacillus toyonensis]